MGCDLRQIAKEAAKSLLDPLILPYYGLNILYGVTQSSSIEDDYGLITSVAFKTAPIWYLLFYIKVFRKAREPNEQVSGFPASRVNNEVLDESGYNINLTIGLVLSILGDALLVFPSTFFHGVFFFGAAQVFYISALRKRYGEAGYAWLVVPVCMLTSPYIMMGLESYAVGAAIILYNVTINTMLFYAISGLESRCTSTTFLGALGAFSFVVSDSLLAFDMWIADIPHRSLIVMSAYYFAQVNLALSVL